MISSNKSSHFLSKTYCRHKLKEFISSLSSLSKYSPLISWIVLPKKGVNNAFLNFFLFLPVKSTVLIASKIAIHQAHSLPENRFSSLYFINGIPAFFKALAIGGISEPTFTKIVKSLNDTFSYSSLSFGFILSFVCPSLSLLQQSIICCTAILANSYLSILLPSSFEATQKALVSLSSKLTLCYSLSPNE